MAVLKAATQLVPDGVSLEIFNNLSDMPLFNQDQEGNPPKVVLELKEKIKSADAILFATPEYNYSIPGVLKNAIDWASRPYGDNAWEGKPVAIMSASGGMLGGSRAQYHLRQTFIFLNMFPINRPEIIIPEVNKKIDDQGDLTDEFTKEKIKRLLQSLVDWATKLNLGQQQVHKR